MQATQKPIMVKAGVYEYRGVRVERTKRARGFTFGVRYFVGNYEYHGHGLSLAKACAEVDRLLATGTYEVLRKGWLGVIPD